MTRIILVLLLSFVFYSFAFIAEAMADVRFKGTTYVVDDANDASYQPLEGVQIWAFNADGPINGFPISSESGGKFDVQFAAGKPFFVVFFYPDKRPDLRWLAAKDRETIEIQIAIRTSSEGVNDEGLIQYILNLLSSRGLIDSPQVAELRALLKPVN